METNSTNRLRIAIQKSGRLSDESFNLLKKCGIKVVKRKNQLFCRSENYPLDILLVRDDDIPSLIRDGICDYGIVGYNTLKELPCQMISNIDMCLKLDFGSCRLSIAVPEGNTYKNISDLQGKRIATSYPSLTKKYFESKNIKATIINLQGSVEIAPRLNMADAISDLVSTGATLESNNLKEVETILNSQAILIKKSQDSQEINNRRMQLFENRIKGVLDASECKYIMLHAPKPSIGDVVTLLPGAENPTIVDLQEDEGRVSLQAVCRESIFWDTIEKLKEVGASSILVMPVEKMMA